MELAHLGRGKAFASQELVQIVHGKGGAILGERKGPLQNPCVAVQAAFFAA